MPFSIQRNDISQVKADAVVLAANTNLVLGGGTAGAMAKAAGKARLQRACDRIGGCPVGQAVATPGFKSLAKTIVHAVGPVWEGGNAGEAELLYQAYYQAFLCAIDAGAQSIATPLISAGIFGYPVQESFDIACRAIRDFLERFDAEIIIVVFGKTAAEVGRRAMADIDEFIDDEYARSHQHRRFSRLADEPLDEASLEASMPLFGSLPPEDFLEDSIGEAAFQESQEPQPKIAIPNLFGRKRASKATRIAEPRESAPMYGAAPARSNAPAPAASASDPLTQTRTSIADDAGEDKRPSTNLAAPSSKGKEFATAGVPGADGNKLRPKGQASAPAALVPSLRDLLDGIDAAFTPTLLQLIDSRNLTDAQVYKRANISRQHFSKMRSNPDYRPTKKTAVALCIALELDLDEACDLLERAGYALSRSSKFDLIIRYFISQENYDIFAINEALFAFDQPILG